LFVITSPGSLLTRIGGLPGGKESENLRIPDERPASPPPHQGAAKRPRATLFPGALEAHRVEAVRLYFLAGDE